MSYESGICIVLRIRTQKKIKKSFDIPKHLCQSDCVNRQTTNQPMKIELIITKDEIEGDVRYNVMDLIDPSFSGRGESFRNLKDATSYCKKHKVGYARRKDMDISES